MTVSAVVGLSARQQTWSGGGVDRERPEWPRTVAAGICSACCTGLGLRIECRNQRHGGKLFPRMPAGAGVTAR